MSLASIQIRVSRILPETVKDGDGRDVPLLGVMVSEPLFDERGAVIPGRIVFLVGEPDPAPNHVVSAEPRG